MTLFTADYETGDTTQYRYTEVNGGASPPVAVTSPTRSPKSKFCGSYTLTGGQYRSESVPAYTGALLAVEGMDRWFGWSVCFPAPPPVGAWQVCGQWRHLNAGNNFDQASPPMSITIPKGSPARWQLNYNGNSPLTAPPWQIDLGLVPVGKWVDVVVHAKFSTTAGNCLVEVWLDGHQVGSIIPSAPLIYPTTKGTFFKVGYYRDPAITPSATVLYDNVKIGPDYSSVCPGCSAA